MLLIPSLFKSKPKQNNTDKIKYFNIIKIFALVIISFTVFNCNNSKKTNYVSVEKTEKEQTHPGKKLMEINCYVCHSSTASHENRIGPPMIAIKKHYINATTTKEEFIEAMQAWIKNPNANDAKMPGAIKRFGIMPKTPYPEKTIKQIADYMFDYDIEQPEWFEDHYNKERGMHDGKGNKRRKGKYKKQAETNFEKLPHAERGLKYALSTKTVLGKNLMGTIQKQGTLDALLFCNENAYPLTDSMSVVHNAIIKRVSDKPRNPNNQANKQELKHIKTYKQVVANNQEPNPFVKEEQDKVHVYYPIVTNTMCLQCHGKPNETIKTPVANKLKAMYPKDKAIGYEVSQVRGIWSVTFNK
ncbi:c-type heme family protein [Gelatiniphilus marinus]|uniref:DUF3365 domain-containing protein n=1 Tax=Gelatiniphilus marinus TaxID=1759464 RepID=A0ABW5JV39_9FLAO